MEINKILNADVLDIIFEGRNKEYGAYDLRKTYNSRLKKSLIGTGTLCCLLFAGYLLANKYEGKKQPLNIVDTTLIEIPDEKKPDPIIEPPKQTPPPVQTIKSVSIRVVPDEEVKPDEQPPEVDQLEDSKIGNVNSEGLKDDGIVAPPIEADNKGIIEAPLEEDYEGIFTSVQIESEYPGGRPAWERFLNKNLSYPQEAADNEIQGTVVVQFIVDKEGLISNVEAVSGPEELRAEAIRVIKKSGKWNSANQNGRLVKSYKKQPIKFQLADN